MKKHLGLILRVVISVGILGFLATKLDWEKFASIVASANPWWLLAAFGMIGVQLALGTWRWMLLINVQGISLGFVKAFEIGMIGQFFNAFLLGVTGGDVAKIYYIAQAHPERRSAASLSVVYDRIVGLLALVFLGLALVFSSLALFTSTPTTMKVTTAFIIMSAVAIAGFFFSFYIPTLRRHPVLWRWEQRLPFHGTLERLSEAFIKYGTNWKVTLGALGVSIIIHLLIFTTFYMVARSLKLEVNYLELATVSAMVNLLIAIPISISGLGAREGLFALFLSLHGVPNEAAVAFSLLGFGLVLAWSVIGGGFYLRYRQPGQRLSELATDPVEGDSATAAKPQEPQ